MKSPMDEMDPFLLLGLMLRHRTLLIQAPKPNILNINAFNVP